MKRMNRSTGGPYVGIGDDGRRPSTAGGQLAELAVPDLTGPDVVGLDGDDGDDFAGADEDSDEDDDLDSDLESGDEPFALDPLAARLSVR